MININSHITIVLSELSGLRIRGAESGPKQRIGSLSTRLNPDVERPTMLIREKKRTDQSEARIAE
jgi:hypothetical protein